MNTSKQTVIVEKLRRQAIVQSRSDVAAYGAIYGAANPLKAKAEKLAVALAATQAEVEMYRHSAEAAQRELAIKQTQLQQAVDELDRKQGFLETFESEHRRWMQSVQRELEDAHSELEAKQNYLEGASEELDRKQLQLAATLLENSEIKAQIASQGNKWWARFGF